MLVRSPTKTLRNQEIENIGDKPDTSEFDPETQRIDFKPIY